MKIFDPKLTGSIAFENAVQGNIEITGDLVVPGSITAREFKTEFVSASIIYQSGSTQFGDTNDDRHLFTGRVGIGTTDPQEELDIASAGPGIQLTDTDGGTARIINLGTDLVIQTDRDNLVDTSTIQFEVDGTEHMRVHTGGNIGIGTINPEADVHIYRADSVALRLESANAGATTLQLGSTAEAAYGRLRYDTGTHDMRFYTNNSEKVRINSDGNVGIGTTSPTVPLYVNGGTGENTTKVIIGGNDAIIRLGDNQGGGPHGLQFDGEGATDGMSMYYRTTPQQISFEDSTGNSGNSVMVIGRDGVVGIGRSTAYSTLHIESRTADDTIITLDKTGTAAKGIKFNRDTSTDASIIVDSNEDLRIGYNEDGLGDNLIIHSSGSNVLVANSNGSVGIGTTPSEAGLEIFKNASQGNPSSHTPANATLKIQDSSNQMYLDGNSIIQTGAASFTFGNTQDSSILFYTNASEKVRFQNDGNVGIGATSPGAKLEIRDTAPFLRITTTIDDDLNAQGREYGGIEWYTEETYGNAPVTTAYVKAIHTRAGTGHSNADAGLVFATSTATNDATAVERMRLEAVTGNLGLGVSSPSTKLHVLGATRFDSYDISDPDATTTANYPAAHTFTHYSEGNGMVVVGGQGNYTGATLTIGQETGASSNFTHFRAIADTNGTPITQFIVKGDGNVGIGAESPGYRLSVSNTDLATDSAAVSFANQNSNSSTIAIFRGASDYIYIKGDGGSGDYEIGNSQQGNAITLKDGTGGVQILYAGSVIGSFADSEIYFADRNVGIGTTSPIGKFNSYISATRQLTHNGNGGDLSVLSDNNNTPVVYVKGTGTADLLYIDNNTTQKLRIASNGNVFMPGLTASSGYNDLAFNTANGQLIYRTSSERYKENIQNLPSTLDKVKSLRTVTYDEKGTGRSYFGLIAEELYQHIPELVTLKTIDGYDEPQPDGITYSMLSVHLVKAIQEQQAIIEALEARIQTLENS